MVGSFPTYSNHSDRRHSALAVASSKVTIPAIFGSESVCVSPLLSCIGSYWGVVKSPPGDALPVGFK
jgi:hypothetical protein